MPASALVTVLFPMSILLGILTFFLILVSLFLILVVLAQKSKDGGMGAALGGGAAEAAFGADTGNVLSKSTIYAAVIFFALAFMLYIGRIYERKHASMAEGNALPSIETPALPPAPKAGAPSATTPAASSPAVTVPIAPAPSGTTPASTSTPSTSSAPAATTPAPEPKKP